MSSNHLQSSANSTHSDVWPIVPELTMWLRINPTDTKYFYNPDNVNRLFIRLSEVIIAVCEGLGFRMRIAVHAIQFLRRFYLCEGVSLSYFDPRLIMSTVLVISMKNNGCYCNITALVTEIVKQKSISFPYSPHSISQAETIVMTFLNGFSHEMTTSFDVLPEMSETLMIPSDSLDRIIAISHAILLDIYKSELSIIFQSNEMAIAAISLALVSQSYSFEDYLDNILQRTTFSSKNVDMENKKLRVRYIIAAYSHYLKAWRNVMRLNDSKANVNPHTGELMLQESDLNIDHPIVSTFKLLPSISRLYQDDSYETTLWNQDTWSFFVPQSGSVFWKLFAANLAESQEDTQNRILALLLKDHSYVFNCRLGITGIFTILNSLNTIPTVVKAST